MPPIEMGGGGEVPGEPPPPKKWEVNFWKNVAAKEMAIAISKPSHHLRFILCAWGGASLHEWA